MTPETGLKRKDQQPERVYGELKWTARAKETSASVFLQGRYSPPIQAILELTDNSVGYRNRNKDKPWPTLVTVTVERNRIHVLDYGGLGTDAAGIKRFAMVGETEEMGIGYRGAGAKYSAWFFGEDLQIKAKKAGDPIEYTTKIIGFGHPKMEYSGIFAIDAEQSFWDKDKGRFELTVWKLHHPENLPGGAALKRALGEVYRPLLTHQDWEGRKPPAIEKRKVVDTQGNISELADKAVMFLATRKKKNQVKPLEIPLLPEYSEENIKLITTDKGEVIWYWAGEMDVKNKNSKNVKQGMRFYYDGRLVNIDFCGFNERDPRLAGLVGEVHLDNIEGIKSQLSVNKSAGVNPESDQWRRVIRTVREALTPLIEAMQKKPLPLFEEVPRFLPNALAQARKLTDICVKELAQDGVFISPEDLRVLVGETKGQKLTQPVTLHEQPQVGGLGEKGKPWRDQQGQTIPDRDALETIPRIRKSSIDRIEYRWLEDQTPVSFFTERKEEDGKTRKVLILNCNNPLVNVALLQGELTTIELIGCELIRNIARIYSTTLEDFLKFETELRFRFGQILSSTPAYKRLEAQRFREKRKTT